MRFCVYLGSVCAFLGFSDLGLSRFISAYLGFISGLSRARGCAFSDLGLSRFISVYLGFISGLASSRVCLGLSRVWLLPGCISVYLGLSRVYLGLSRVYLGYLLPGLISGPGFISGLAFPGLSRVYLGFILGLAFLGFFSGLARGGRRPGPLTEAGCVS